MRCALGRGDRETPWARVRAARRVAVMDLQLTDKVAVVTGASEGIGLAVVRELAVNVASVNAFFEPDGAVVDYGAAKAALLNVSKALSQELAPKGIRINSVSPGPVATDLWLGDDGVAATIGRATGAEPDAIRTQVIDQGIPTGRFSTPEEVATLVALLASPRTANVTGSDYVIDGGLIKTM